MINRIVVVGAVVIALLSLVFFSQLRTPANNVSGFIEADEIRVGSRVGGRVARVAIEEGARVATGELLVELEPFDLLEQEREAKELLSGREAAYQRLVHGFRDEEKAQAKARYDQLKANLDMLVAGPRSQEIEAGRARLQLAEAERELAQRSHDRARRLIESNAISREELDRSSEALQAAHARYLVRQHEFDLLNAGTRVEEIDQMRARLEEARQAWLLSQNGYREEEIEQARAARDAVQATLQAIEQRKQELKIISPVQGIVEALELQRGDLVAANAPVLSILDDRNLWVRAYVPEDRLDISVGDELSVSVDSYPQSRFLGRVSFIARQAEFTPSNAQTPDERAKQVFRVKVKLLDGLDQLRPGMAADVWLKPREEDARRQTP